MCGISGFIGSNPSENIDYLSIVSKMLKKISHRGPDLIGQIINKKEGIIFGHNRLTIQDLTDAGSQPMNSFSKRYLITFNGEIYNHNAIRKIINKSSGQEIQHPETSKIKFFWYKSNEDQDAI